VDDAPVAATTPVPAATSTVLPRVVLHIGLHKSGTTYLQSVLAENAGALADHAIYVAAGRGAPPVLRAVDDLQGRRQVAADERRTAGQWAALVTAVRECGRPLAVVSDERLSLSGAASIDRVRSSFAGCELHVVVTVRDIARTLVSSWEEAVRGRATWTWDEYVAAVRDETRRGVNPARSFWVRQDLLRIMAAWEAVVPPERLTVVTTPVAGSDPGALLARFGDACGFDPTWCPRPPRRENAAIGPAATEVLRRFNAATGDLLDRRQYNQLVKFAIAPRLAAISAGAATIPPAELPWLDRLAAEQVVGVRERGYRVVGDLDDLRPRPAAEQRTPDPAERDVADAAVAALAAVAAAWSARPPGASAAPPEAGAGPTQLGSRVRGWAFGIRRAVLRAGDANPVVGRAVGAAYRLRERRQERTLRLARRTRGGPPVSRGG
jgi:hypothetical protein